MTKSKDDDQELRDGQKVRVRVALLMMDNQTAFSHRPGYRVSAKMLIDSEAREELADAYQDYQDGITTRWQNASPEPVMTLANALLDEEFDDSVDHYAAYDSELSSRWKGK